MHEQDHENELEHFEDLIPHRSHKAGSGGGCGGAAIVVATWIGKRPVELRELDLVEVLHEGQEVGANVAGLDLQQIADVC